uniref:Uncharacterized protein n=1 Tax=Magallana gigas TaxID=29159 RepID=A0A8W8N0U0_MAGGI
MMSVEIESSTISSILERLENPDFPEIRRESQKKQAVVVVYFVVEGSIVKMQWPQYVRWTKLQLKPPVVRFSSTKGDNSEQVEVIEYTDTELMDSSSGAGMCGATKGPHITLMTLILWPVAIFPSLAVAFYYGAWTWSEFCGDSNFCGICSNLMVFLQLENGIFGFRKRVLWLVVFKA